MPSDEAIISDGSGSGRASAPLLIFSILLLLNGLYLSAFGKRGFRFTTAAGFGLIGALIGWALLVDLMPSNQVYFSHSPHSDLTIAISSLAFYIFFFILGYSFLWPLGILALGWSAGMSIALNLLLLTDGLTIHVVWAQWLLIGVCGAVGFFALTLLSSTLMPIATGFVGSFCLLLAIDLLVNEDSGASLGLRMLLDRNASHQSVLQSLTYAPSMSTQTFIAVSWALGLLSSTMQRVFYTDPFIPNSHLDVENGTKSGHGKLSKTPTSVSEGARSETRSRVASLPIWREFHRQSFSSNQPQSLEPAESLRDDVHSSTSSPVPSSVFEDPSSHTLVRAVSQQFRSQWAGALSQYSVTLDTPRTSSLLRPLKRREREMSMAGN